MTTLVPSISNKSSSFLQVTRPTVKAWMSLNFGKISSLTLELAALEHLKNQSKCCDLSSAFIFYVSSSFLHATRTPIKARIGPKFGRIQSGTYELPALERLEKSQYLYNGRNFVTTLVLSNLNGSSSFLQIQRTTVTINATISLNFVKTPSPIMELAPLVILKN